MLLVLCMSMLMADTTTDIFYQGTVAEVMAKAKKENKVIVVDVYATWCGPCKLMDRTTFVDSKVVKLLTGDAVIAYKIDAEKGEGIAFARKYRVRGYPCILIIDGDGKLIDRNLGFMKAPQLVSFVKANIP